MKVEEESAKAGLQLNMKKTKVMITEELHNFSTDHEETEIVRDLVYLGSPNQSKERMQPEKSEDD